MVLKIDPEYVDIHIRTMKEIEHDPSRLNQSHWVTAPVDYVWTIENADRFFEVINYDLHGAMKVYADLEEFAYCYAGHALRLSGYRFINKQTVVSPKGQIMTAHEASQRVLGLSDEDTYCVYRSAGDWNPVAAMKQRMTRLTGIEFD
jgi:hypothetical protein